VFKKKKKKKKKKEKLGICCHALGGKGSGVMGAVTSTSKSGRFFTLGQGGVVCRRLGCQGLEGGEACDEGDWGCEVHGVDLIAVVLGKAGCGGEMEMSSQIRGSMSIYLQGLHWRIVRCGVFGQTSLNAPCLVCSLPTPVVQGGFRRSREQVMRL
jgi:hypothetical protein